MTRFTFMNSIIKLLIAAFIICGTQIQAQSLQVIEQDIPKKASFRGLSAVNENVAWASGSGGTVLITVNGGETWKDVSVPGADSIQFRDIEAFDDKKAVIMGVGSPAKFYYTEDGGSTWEETYINKHPKIFFDAMGFWDKKNGISFSDAVEGHLVIVTTKNGGKSWKEIDYTNFPTSPEGEGGFAASGTCITTFGKSTVWIGLGSPSSRVFKSEDKGKTWTVVETTMKKPKPTGGIFSLEFTSAQYGLAVGGDYEDDKDSSQNAAISTDGGETWEVINKNQPDGFKSVVANIPKSNWWLAAGTSGIDLSKDNGKTWEIISKEGYHAANFGSSKIGWLSGGGKIAKIIITDD